MAKVLTFEAVFDILKLAAQNNVKFAAEICNIVEDSKEAIKLEYDETRRKAKETFMVNDKGLLDRHKCAAAWMIAILKGLNTSPLEGDPSIRKTIREHLAIIAGLTVLVNMIEGDCENPKNTAIVDYWRANNRTVHYPEVLQGNGKYVDNWAVELYHARKKDLLFILALANELFMIEVFNRMLVLRTPLTSGMRTHSGEQA